jgi:hypothetical protein
MGKFSEIKSGEKHCIKIHAGLFLQDHSFLGKAVLPAVEAMKALAHSTRALADEIDVTRITKASFQKLLPIPPEPECIEAFNLVEHDNTHDYLQSSLITIFRSKTSSITRPVTHVTLRFGLRESFAGKRFLNTESFGQERDFEDICDEAIEDTFEILPEFIYERMIPFGPAFRNIAAPIRLTRQCVMAEVSGGHPEYVERSPLGSPFPLDAAFHAACAWGQRYLRYVAFPVGLEERRILRPTVSGENYFAYATPVQADSRSLLFDIRIFAKGGALCEECLAVLMKDVSKGHLKPPPEIIAS